MRNKREVLEALAERRRVQREPLQGWGEISPKTVTLRAKLTS